ncbi:MAG: hypothetical protein ABI900_08455 [Betaproteobacteria bacterium]
MKALLFLALIALLSGCIPIGIRGTSIVEAGTQHPAASAFGEAAATPPARPTPAQRRA